MESPIKDGAELASDQSASAMVTSVTSLMKSLTVSAYHREDEPEYWTRLPVDVDAMILGRVPFPYFLQKSSVCKSFRDILKRQTFQQERARLFSRECSLSPIVFYVRDMLWHILGYDYANQKWRRLPPFDKRIPIPNMDLFKDFLVTSHGGLFCVNVGKPTDPERILVFNPSTGKTIKIPPLKFTRHPVVLSMHVTLTKSGDTVTSWFRIVAVGSSTTRTETVSRKTEIYDSTKGKWEDAGDVPGTDFSVNEHQSGVICERLNLLLVTGFMHNGSKGLLAFEFTTLKWREDWLCPFYRDQAEDMSSPVHFAIAQLVLCDGEVYLFSEQEEGRAVNHCIDKLDLFSNGGYTWTRKVKRPRQGYRALLVYPEYTCVPVRDNKLCIFNTIERTGVIYNMLADTINPDVYEVVPTTPVDGIVFHSLNPVEYAYEPSFVVPIEQPRPEQTRADQGRPEQTNAKQSRPEQTGAEQSRPDQSRSDDPNNLRQGRSEDPLNPLHNMSAGTINPGVNEVVSTTPVGGIDSHSPNTVQHADEPSSGASERRD